MVSEGQPKRFSEIAIGGIRIMLDLSNSHEKTYLYRTLGEKSAQADIDVKIFNRFVQDGDIVLDAGGNIGVTAAEMIASGAKTVHVFEIHPNLIERLKSINSGSIIIHPFGLSDRDAQIDLFESKTHNQGSTTDRRIVEMIPYVFGGADPIRANVRSLDSVFGAEALIQFGEPRFDFMKVDIEGAETAFLRGAKGVLSRFCPRAMSIELFDPIFDEAHLEASQWFAYCYRALIGRNDYELQLIKYEENYEKNDFFPTSPMYVFTNIPI